MGFCGLRPSNKDSVAFRRGKDPSGLARLLLEQPFVLILDERPTI
jgi:hypothetical protein